MMNVLARWCSLLFAVMLFTEVLPGGLRSESAAAEKRPNVVLILMDDMGYADLGCMGSPDLKTPQIDRLAGEGVRFTDFYSNAPVCTPTRAALMTGRWQQRCGLEWAMGFTAEQTRRQGDKWVPEPDKASLGLPTSELTLPRMLKQAGYATGAFGKWHLGFQPEYRPTKHGFDEYFGVLLGHADYYRYSYFDGTYHLFEQDQPAKAEGYLTDLVNDRAVDFIERHAKEPFFLYVPYLAVHWPFQPPDRPEPALTEKNKYSGTRKDYAQMLQRVDDGVGRMLATLERLGIADDTVFIFTGDNGGERLSDNRPLFNHKTTLWEGGIRVPCLIRWPGKIPSGKVIHQPAISMDLTRTILSATGVNPPPERKLDGIDLLPHLRGEKKDIARTFYWRVNRADRKQKAVRHGKWKFMQDSMVEMLFDLENDISEREDLAYRRPEVVAELKKLLADWEAELEKNPPPFRVQ